jgi:NAD(P)-dependent dehydrogenase (short-subunit alcohol dehydrogenase family)
MNRQNADGVLITGASTGIGKACALLLDRSGYKVFAGVRKIEAGKQLQEESSKNLSPVILDITDPEQIANAFEFVKKALGPDRGLKALINNAGIGVVGPVEFLPLSVLRQHFEVNVIGHIAVTQIFLSLIRIGKGRIVTMGSGSGRFALPLLGAYAASKFAMEALTDSLRRELHPWGIPVSIIEPGTVETPIWEKGMAMTEKMLAEFPAAAEKFYAGIFSSGIKIMESGRRRAISSEAVARVVRKALEAETPRTRYVVGADARMAVVGSFLPDRFTDWVISKIFKNKLSTRILGW